MKRTGGQADLDALRSATLATGGVAHRDCGGKIIYTFTRDAYLCQGCQGVWPRIKVEPPVNQRQGTPLSYKVPGLEIDVIEAEKE